MSDIESEILIIEDGDEETLRYVWSEEVREAPVSFRRAFTIPLVSSSPHKGIDVSD